MKTSNDLTAYIDGFKDDISGNNILLVPFVRNGLVLYVFNKLSNRNANETAKILALLQGRHNINIDALKRSVLRLNENLVKMKKNITRAWNEIVELLREFLQQYNHPHSESEEVACDTQIHKTASKELRHDCEKCETPRNAIQKMLNSKINEGEN